MSVIAQPADIRSSTAGTEKNSVPVSVSTGIHPPQQPKSDRVPGRRTGQILFLVGLLAVEIFLVAIRHWWVDLLGEFRDLSSLVITLVVAMAVFSGDRLRRAGNLITAHARTTFPWSRALLQVTVYTGFVLFTRHVVTSQLHTSANGGAWTAAWALWGFGVLALWGWTVMPLRGWQELVRRAWKDAILASVVVCVAWGASRYSQHLWKSLADDTLRAVEIVLRLFFSDVTVEASERIIGARDFVVHIAPSCSGYEGFGLVAAVIGCYLWLCRETLRFPAALLLLPLAVGLSWVLNTLRISALIAIGVSGWPVIAMNGFHTQAGWLAFNAIAIGVVFFSRSSRFFSRQASTEIPAARGPNPAAPFLVPLLVIVGAAMVTAAASSGGLDRFYVVRVAIAALVLWKYRRSYSGLGWSWNWVAVGVGIAVFGVWIGLEELLPPEPADAAGDPFLLPALERWMWLVSRVVGAVVLVPIAEELAFRGYLLRRLQGAELGEDMKNRWNWVAVLISSVLFGLLHPGRWIAGTLAGGLFAWIFYRRGRLSDAILAHAITNAILAVYVLATKQWGLW